MPRLVVGEPVVVPVRLDRSAACGRRGEVSPLLGGLIRVRRSDVCCRAAVRAGCSGWRVGARSSRERVLVDLVRGQVAVVLGLWGCGGVEVERAFSDLGFDSLMAVELRNRLGAATGLRFPATVVFDYPSVVRLAGFCRTPSCWGRGIRVCRCRWCVAVGGVG